MPLKDTLRYIVLGGIFLVPFIPLIVSASMFFPFITGKNFAFRILIELLFAAWVSLALLDTRYRPRFSYILATLTFFVASLLISNLMSPDVFRAIWSNFERMEGWVTFAHLLLYFLMLTSVMTTEKLWWPFWYTTIAGGVLAAFSGINQINNYVNAGAPIGRVDATFGNPTYLAIFAVFQIFLLMLCMFRTRNYFLHAFFTSLATLQAVVLYFTATRGAILGFIGGMAVTGFIIAIGERASKTLRMTALGIMVAMVTLVVGFYAIKDTAFVRESPVLQRFASISLDAGTVGSRFMIWGMAWEGFKERPLLGWGQEGFVAVFSKYYDPNMYAQEPWFDRTHNVFLDWLIAGGIVGFLAYFSIPAAVLYYLWFNPLQTPPSGIRRVLSWFRFVRHDEHPMTLSERAVWTGFLAAYFVHNIFVFDNLTSYLIYIALLAYIHVRVTQKMPALFPSYTLSKENVAIIVLPVALVTSLAFVYFANIRSIEASWSVIRALRVVGEAQRPPDQVSSEMKREYYQEALERFRTAQRVALIGRQEVAEQYAQMAARVARSDAPPEVTNAFIAEGKASLEKQIAANPNDARTHLMMGTFLALLGRTQEAVPFLERARDLSPGKQAIRFELGARYFELGETEKAHRTFEEAYHLAPQNPEARHLHALGLIHTGRIDEAEALYVSPEGTMLFEGPSVYVNASGTLIIDDDRFLRAYEIKGRFDRVVAILEERLARAPDSVQAHVSLAAGYAGAGNPQAAIRTLERAIALDPSFEAQGKAFIAQIRSGADLR